MHALFSSKKTHPHPRTALASLAAFCFSGVFFALTATHVFAGDPSLNYFQSAADAGLQIVELLIPAAVTIALILFFWGLAVFIFKADDEEGRKRGRQIMIWGLIALFVIVSVWGLVAILRSIFGITKTDNFGAPGVSNLVTD